MTDGFIKAKQYVTTLGPDISFDDIPVVTDGYNIDGRNPLVNYTIKRANDDIYFAMRLLGGGEPPIGKTPDGSLDEVQTLMKKLYDNNKIVEIFDFIKIDVQGSELDILKGGSNVVKKAKGILLELSIEEFNINAPLYKDVEDYMNSINFSKKETLQQLRHPQHHYHIQDDVLFINNSIL